MTYAILFGLSTWLPAKVPNELKQQRLGSRTTIRLEGGACTGSSVEVVELVVTARTAGG